MSDPSAGTAQILEFIGFGVMMGIVLPSKWFLRAFKAIFSALALILKVGIRLEGSVLGVLQGRTLLEICQILNVYWFLEWKLASNK